MNHTSFLRLTFPPVPGGEMVRSTVDKVPLRRVATEVFDNRVALSVQGTTIRASTSLLERVSYFKSMLNGSLTRGQPMVFDECRPETFEVLLEHLQSSELPEKGRCREIADIIDLYCLAVFVELDTLRDKCRDMIHDVFSKETFVNVALMNWGVHDLQITRLCSHFLRKNPGFGKGLDLSAWRPLDVLILYEVGEEFEAHDLSECCLEELKSRVTLDDGFEELCYAISKHSDQRLKMGFLQFLNKGSILEKLHKGKGCLYEREWQAYQTLF